MKQKLIFVLLLVTLPMAVRAESKPLSLDDFIATALKHNPAVRKIRATYDQSRSLAMKADAIKDIFLSAGTAWAWYSQVWSSGSLSLEDKNEWSVYASLSKRFPNLLGMDTTLSFAHSSILSTDPSGVDKNSHTPSLTLTVTIPLLKNFLGRVDNNDLKRMRLAISMADRYETEALEALLITLYSAYLDWAVASEKAMIYKGSMDRAAVVLNQNLRKQQLGIADQADLALANQSFLTHRTRHLAALTDKANRYHDLLALMRGDAPGKTNLQVTIGHEPVMDWDKQEIPADSIIPKMDDLRVVQLSRLLLEDARLALNSANSTLKPEFDVVVKAGTGSSKTALGSALSGLDQNTLYGGVQFSLPLQNTAEKQARAAALAALQKTEAEHKALLVSLGYSLRSIEHALKAGEATLKVQKQVVNASLVRINAIWLKYQQGRVSLENVTDARDAYATQQVAYIERSAALKKLALEYASLSDLLARRHPLDK